MKPRLCFPVALLLITSPALLAQCPAQESESRPQNHHENSPRANQGHIPPAPPKANAHNFKREQEHRQNGSDDHTPHVNNDRWYGHEAPNDKRFHVDRPFEHGRFEHFGPSYRYTVTRIDRDHHRFWFPNGFYVEQVPADVIGVFVDDFQIADWEWPLAADWCWDCGDDFDIQTGVYIHVTYLGS